MSVWTSWAIRVNWPHTEEEIIAIPGVIKGDNWPIFDGSLDEFSNEFHQPFTVHHEGRYITVGTDV